jgi:putative membrane protein
MIEMFTAKLLSLCLASQPADPDAIWSAWSLAPEVVVPLIVCCALYFRGCFRLASRHDPRRPSGIEMGVFAIGMTALAVAVISPLCRMAATLAWAHMVQHAILVIAAPLLILLGRPGAVLAAAAPRLKSLHVLEPAGRPLGAGLLYGAAIWLWHVPLLYQAALLDRSVHLLMYGSLLAAGFVFWRVAVRAIHFPHEQAGAAAVTLLATIIHTGLLGALLTFSQAVWYPLVSAEAGSWRLSPLEDQQLAGLIMWVPMGVAYLAAALTIIGAWLNALTPRRSA